MEFTKELVNKAKACKTAEELIALAKENGYELSPEEAELYLQDFAEGELSDEELDNVAGGAEGCKPVNTYEYVEWNKPEDVQFIFKEGDIVQALAFASHHHTATCKVVNRRVQKFYRDGGKYTDQYWLEKEPGVRAPFISDWYCRDDIEK